MQNNIKQKIYQEKKTRNKKIILVKSKDRRTPKKEKDLIGHLRSGTLGQFGYSDIMHKTLEQRRRALKKAVASHGWLSIFRKLNAVYVLNKNTNPPLAAKFLKDRNWVRKNFRLNN